MRLLIIFLITTSINKNYSSKINNFIKVHLTKYVYYYIFFYFFSRYTRLKSKKVSTYHVAGITDSTNRTATCAPGIFVRMTLPALQVTRLRQS